MNYGFAKILAPSLRELARRCFSAETEGELTLGSPTAFAADSVWRGSRAIQSNTPSVSPQKRRRSTSDVTTSRMMEKLSSTTKINRFSVSLIAQIRGALIWLPDASERKAIRAKPKAKSLFMFYHIEDKSAFRRASC